MLYFKINTGYIFLPTCLVDGPEDKKGGEQAPPARLPARLCHSSQPLAQDSNSQISALRISGLCLCWLLMAGVLSLKEKVYHFFPTVAC